MRKAAKDRASMLLWAWEKGQQLEELPGEKG